MWGIAPAIKGNTLYGQLFACPIVSNDKLHDD